MGTHTNLRNRLGARLDDLRLEPREALRVARDIGFSTIEMSAAAGPLSPPQLSRTGRRDLLRHVSSLGLELGALTAASQGKAYADPRQAEAAVERMLRILELAAELGTPVVTTAVAVPGQEDRQGLDRIREAFSLFAAQADRTGRRLAVAPRGVQPEWLVRLVRELNCPNVQTCLDSGELIARGVDLRTALELSAGHLGWIHLRDALSGSPDSPGQEAAPGQGDLDLESLLAGLHAAEYGGPLVMARSGGSNPTEEFRAAYDLWRPLTGG